MASRSTLAFSEQVEYLISWEEDRKFILRGWCFIFIILATLLMFSVGDGRMAYLQGPYTGYLGFWTNCRRHRCANVGQVTVFRRLVKIDFVFSSLSISIGLLILLSLTLFVVDCQSLHPRPQVSYLVTFYLCLCSSGLMLWAGGLSYLNQVGLWSRRMPTMERRMSYRRWAFQQGAVGRLSQQQDSDPEQTEDSSFSDQGDTQDPTTKNSSAIQNTEL
ncbi:uncharacterized protein [Dipodomys merriami]|uniref:uncharacterized protein isoform X2 n=1 Tax=Dipodomys merriami TaxID=94247 RepID=UPI003855EB45